MAALALAGPGAARAPLPDYRAITLRVAGAGLPQCRSYLPDGSEVPCLPRVTLRRGHAVDGWSAGGEIILTEGAVRRLTADELALLAGHEIAHWYLGHTASTLANEAAADRLGAELACQAGYDVAKGVGLFRYVRESAVYPAAGVRVGAVLGRVEACLIRTGDTLLHVAIRG
ncbi:MAG: M48 family metalloprotease [Novosphingobium sp.]